MGRNLLGFLVMLVLPYLFGLVMSKIIHWWVGAWATWLPLSDTRFDAVKRAYTIVFNDATEFLALWGLGYLFLMIVMMVS
jgi:hypothetical protein